MMKPIGKITKRRMALYPGLMSWYSTTDSALFINLE